MWLFTMFDLPTHNKEARKRYTQFRTFLLKQGFTMMQYSVYSRYCASEEVSKVHRKRIKTVVPPEGHVRVLSITDHQFGKMESYYGRQVIPTENPPDQMLLL